MRGPNGFGFSLRGGAEYDNSPLAVSDVQKFGPADEGGICPDDEILGINGVSTQGIARAWALSLIGQYPVVKLFMRKTIKLPQQTAIQAPIYNINYEQYQQNNPYQMYGLQQNGQQPIYGTEDDLQFFANERQRAQL